MSKPVYFMQECPTCGRALEIRVALLGKQVVCQHCLAEFEACDPMSRRYHCHSAADELLHRAEELLSGSVQQQQPA